MDGKDEYIKDNESSPEDEEEEEEDQPETKQIEKQKPIIKKSKKNRQYKIYQNINKIVFLKNCKQIQNMQQTISNKIQLGDTLNPLKDAGGVPSIDDKANLENLYSKVDKTFKFWKTGQADDSLARYIPNLTETSRQNQFADANPRKAFT